MAITIMSLDYDLIAAPAKLLDLARQEIKRDPRLKSEHTQRGYIADLAAFERWRSGRLLTRFLVEEYAASLQAAGKAPASINRALAGIRWWARRWAAQAQEMPAITADEQRERAEMVARAERVASIGIVTGNRLPAGRHITPGELAALMEICEDDPRPAGVRDAALIAVAYSAGPRRAELAGLALGDITTKEENEGELIFHGKGDSDRKVPLIAGYPALVDWIEILGADQGPIFCEIGKGGKIKPAESLSGESMRLILDKRREAAGVVPLTWHDFRRTFAGNLLDSGVDLVTVQRLMGHKRSDTTANYDRRGDEVKRSAVKVLFVPYRGNRAWMKK